MIFSRATLAAVAIIAVLAGEVRVQAGEDEAGRLFESGHFAEARAAYAKIEAQAPGDYLTILQLGRIALLENQLDAAVAWFEKAIALKPREDDPKVMLAEAHYRRDDFEKAAAALTGVDVGANQLVIAQYPTLNVAKLESFKGQIPYDLKGESESTTVKFVATDPLPVVNVRVNGGREVTFFIDTGGSEVALDTDFAREVGIANFGAVQGTFSGGEHAAVQQGRIETLGIGEWEIKNLPVIMLPLRQLSEGLGVKEIDGIIGTTLFYHFLATLDFPKGELVLRRKNAANRDAFLAQQGDAVACPSGSPAIISWSAGDASKRWRLRFCSSIRGWPAPASSLPSR